MRNATLILEVLALLLFGLGTFGYVAKINAVSAGLFCLTLALLFIGGR